MSRVFAGASHDHYILTPTKWHDVAELPASWPGCVATVGVFDGLHRGHQALVHRTRELATEFGLPTVLVTFDPHPLVVLRPTDAPRLLTSVAERGRMAIAAGIDAVFVQRFDHDFAQVAATDWIERFLVQGLRVRSVVVGQDFKFGAGNAGDVATLKAAGERLGFSTEAVPLVMSDGQRCSSTRVRQLREAGRVSEVAELLGHPDRS